MLAKLANGLAFYLIFQVAPRVEAHKYYWSMNQWRPIEDFIAERLVAQERPKLVIENLCFVTVRPAPPSGFWPAQAALR